MVTTIKTEKRICLNCNKKFMTFLGEVNRGRGKVCSRSCYYEYQKKTRPKGDKSWAWKGDSVGKQALHNWVEKHLGKPQKCEHCKMTDCKKYEWANKSNKYRRDLSDWIRLCSKCHAKFDYPERIIRWRKSVSKLGWKTKD